MKFRTTVEDAVHFAFCNRLPATGFVSLSRVAIPQICVRPDDRINHECREVPKKDSDYNHLSIADMPVFQKFKGMERHHQQDAVAAELKRGTLLKSYAKSDGPDNFVNRYTKNQSK